MLKQLLLHEWIFGVYLLVMAVSLSVAEGLQNLDTGVFWGLLTANITVIIASLYHRSSILCRWLKDCRISTPAFSGDC